MAFSSLVLRYQSAGMIPPPYTHFYMLTAKPAGQRLAVDFSITYTDRDELDEEDIMGEGFTLSDDFSWAGELGTSWLTVLNNLLNKSDLHPLVETDLGEQDAFVEVRIVQTGQPARVGTPADADTFLYTIQELIQAIYEAGGKEKPLELIYLQYGGRGDLEIRLTASFAERQVRLMRQQEGRETSRSLPWEALRQTLSAIYAHDFNPDDSLPRPPKRDGYYLNMGGAEWYDITPQKAVQQVLEEL